MELNKGLKKRIDEVNRLLNSVNKDLAEKAFIELYMIFSKADESLLSESVVSEIKVLEGQFVINSVKKRLKEVSTKERKIRKIDDFNHLCDLMKYQQFDEAVKKFSRKTE